jgi:uncharacterized membrane protein HdeD (DUF308 family)
MTNHEAVRDERTIAVENASFRLGYLFLAFGILLIAAYRGLVQDEESWELLALVILSGVVTALYQGSRRILTRSWATAVLTAVIVAALLGAGMAFLR